MSTKMSLEERESFLAEPRVGVLAIDDPGRAPLAAPVWYAYEPGGAIRLVTGRQSRKGRLMAAAGRASLCVQDETLPYRYVSVEGPVTFSEPDRERDSRPIARRYLGEEGGDRYLEGEMDTFDNVLVTLTPERWLTVDYGKVS